MAGQSKINFSKLSNHFTCGSKMSRNDSWQQNDPWRKNEDDGIYVDDSEELNDPEELHVLEKLDELDALRQIQKEKEEELVLMKIITVKQTELAQKQDTLIANQARYIKILQKELGRQKRDVKNLFTENQKLQAQLDTATMELNALITITENGDDNESEN